MRAVDFEKIDFIKELYLTGSDLHVKNNEGFTALDLAKKSLEGKTNKNEIAVSEKIIDILRGRDND